MSLEELIGLRDAELAQVDAILANAEADDREVTEEERDDIKKRRASLEDLAGRITAKQDLLEDEDAITAIREQATAIPKPKTLPTGPVSSGVRESLLDDPKRGWRTSSDFYSQVVAASTPGSPVDRRLLIGAAAAGMSQGTATAGGFAVPPEFSQTIWDGMRNMPNNLLSRTNNYTVTGDSLSFPANAETSRAAGSRYGGVQGYWIAEAGSITVSNPTLRQITLEPKELAVLVPVTDKLLRNGPALGQYVTTAATEEIDVMVGDSIVNGDGIGKPVGLMTATCKVQATRTTASKFFQLDVANMWIRLHPRAMMNAVWLVDQSVLGEILNMFHAVTNVAGAENVGGFSSSLFNPNGGVGWGTLVGRPIIVTEYGKALGTSGDVILCDLGAYLTGTRAGGIDTASSIHIYFHTAQTCFRFMFAVDGQCELQSAITPLSGGDTVTTVVDLS
jgi:HK97 family phage major capsid protein